MNCSVVGQPGPQGFRGEAGLPGSKGRLHEHYSEIVDLVYFISYNVTHSHASNSVGDRGLAGFQGLKGLL